MRLQRRHGRLDLTVNDRRPWSIHLQTTKRGDDSREQEENCGVWGVGEEPPALPLGPPFGRERDDEKGGGRALRAAASTHQRIKPAPRAAEGSERVAGREEGSGEARFACNPNSTTPSAAHNELGEARQRRGDPLDPHEVKRGRRRNEESEECVWVKEIAEGSYDICVKQNVEAPRCNHQVSNAELRKVGFQSPRQLEVRPQCGTEVILARGDHPRVAEVRPRHRGGATREARRRGARDEGTRGVYGKDGMYEYDRQSTAYPKKSDDKGAARRKPKAAGPAPMRVSKRTRLHDPACQGKDRDEHQDVVVVRFWNTDFPSVLYETVRDELRRCDVCRTHIQSGTLVTATKSKAEVDVSGDSNRRHPVSDPGMSRSDSG
ncbi:hypothetical protein B0H16DRAFT_1795267 [Mycena metata]|uniref:Uncharacterized protein n=1 Tax=Mycena metata TaxID=1033252 RepID=A0AAD7HFE0_9AGAR|nr:hypothetical protein B0H16DRAFT_1795267 [Mycena metata]